MPFYDLTPPPPPAPWLYAGLDLGQAADFSALAIAERDRQPATAGLIEQASYDLSHLQRWPLKTPYPTIVADVAAMIRVLAGRTPAPQLRLVVDATGVGRPVVDLLVRERLPCQLIAVTITGGNQVNRDGGALSVPKRDLVSTAQVLLQSRRLRIADALPDARTLTEELLAFQVKITAAANDTYGAWREGAHDDLVLAGALACWFGEYERLPQEAIGSASYPVWW